MSESLLGLRKYYEAAAPLIVRWIAPKGKVYREVWLRGWENGKPIPSNRPALVYSEDLLIDAISSLPSPVEIHATPELFRTVKELEEPDMVRFAWDLVFDLDAGEGALGDALIAAIRLVEFLNEQAGVDPLVKFSGSRGFHIIIPFPVLALVYPEERLPLAWPIEAKLMATTIVKEAFQDFEPVKVGRVHVDLSIYTVRHMLRTPWSIHRSGYVSCFVEDLETFRPEDCLLDNAPEPFIPRKEIRRSKVRRMTRFIPLEKVSAVRNVVTTRNRSVEREFKRLKGKIPPCIEEIRAQIKEDRAANLHDALFTYATWLWHAGYDVQQILDEIRLLLGDRYDEKLAEYQVNHIVTRGYEPRGCVSMKAHGYCPLKTERFCFVFKGKGVSIAPLLFARRLRKGR